MSKEGYDAGYEASRIQTFISKFKDKKIKELEDEIKKIKALINKLKYLKWIVKKILPNYEE